MVSKIVMPLSPGRVVLLLLATALIYKYAGHESCCLYLIVAMYIVSTLHVTSCYRNSPLARKLELKLCKGLI